MAREDVTALTLSPRVAVTGQMLNIFGQNLPWQDRLDTIVMFGSAPATPIRMSDRVILVEVPDGAESGPLQIISPSIGVLAGPEFTLAGVQITPDIARLGYSETIEFGAEVFGSGDDLIWLVDGVQGGSGTIGTITAEGVYTAPSPTSGGSFPFAFNISAETADGFASGSAAVFTGCEFPGGIVPLGVETGGLGSTQGMYTACYEFEAGERTAATFVLTSNRTMRFAVVAPDGRTLISDQQSNHRWKDIRLPQSGSYTVLLGSRDTNDLSYTLGISDQFVESLPVVQLASSAEGEIEGYNDVDDHPVSLTMGQRVTAQVDWLGGQTSVTNPTSIALVDAITRIPLAMSEPGSAPDPLGARIEDVYIPTTGEYILQVSARGTNAGEQFSYRLTADAPGVDIEQIAYGEAKSGFLQGASIDCWDFEGQAGDVVTITAAGNSPSLRFQLFAPSGISLDASPVVGSSYMRDSEILAETGTYRLMVRPDLGRASPYVIGLSDQAVEVLSTPAFGSPVQASLSPFGDVDEYPVMLAAGERVGAEVQSVNGRPITLSIVGPDGSVVTGGQAGAKSDVRGWTVPVVGSYLLRVAASEPGSAADGYSLVVDSASAEVFALAAGASVAVPIESGADLQTVEIEAAAGDVAWLSLSPTVPVDMELYDPAGVVLRTASHDASFRWEEQAFSASGTHRLVIEAGPDAPAEVLVGLSDQQVSSPDPIEFGVNTSGSLVPYGDVDEYVVTLESGQVVSAAATATRAIELHLLDAATRMRLVTGTPPGSGSPDGSIVDGYEVPATGAYLLQVAARDADSSGTPAHYTLVVDALGADARPIGFGESIAATLGAGESQDWTFTLPADGFATLSASGNAGLEYQLFGPGGVPIDASPQAGPVYRRFDVTSPAGGIYMLRVMTFQGQGGSYTVSLSDQAVEAGRPLEFGVTLVDSIDPFGDVDEYELDVTAGQPVTVSVNWVEPADGDATAFGEDSARVRILAEGRTIVFPGSQGFGSDPRDSRVLSWIPGVTETVVVQVYAERVDPRNRYRYLIQANEN